MAEVKFIIFVLGKQKFGVDLSDISGIEQNYDVVPMPYGGTKDIKGIINLRGQIIPVLDLKSKFRITDECVGANKQLLVANTHGISIGIEVDDMIGIIALDESEVKGIPDAINGEETEYLKNVIWVSVDSEDSSRKQVRNQDGKRDVILCVGIDTILTENEFNSVSDALEKRKNADEKNS